jgi:hypothetical protein
MVRWMQPACACMQLCADLFFLIFFLLSLFLLCLLSSQPLRLQIKKELTARSDRVKSVDIHPAEVSLSNASRQAWSGDTCVPTASL